MISILQAVSNHPGGYTPNEIVKKTGIPQGTISPILKTLLNYRLLELDSETNKYTIGIQTYYLGSSFIGKNSTLELIRQEMKMLSNECNETCQIGVLKEGQVFYLLKVEGKDHIRIASEVGGSLPAYATALGKVLLSHCIDSDLGQLYADGLTPLTPNTITDMEVLQEQLQDVRTKGIATEKGESAEYTSCIAVPIFQNEKVVAALSVVFPDFRDTPEKRKLIEEVLLKHKHNIEKILLNKNLL